MKTRNMIFLGAFVVLVLALIGIFLLFNRDDADNMGFDSKEIIAQKIYAQLGNIPTKDLRYEEFIRKYPEGDNALYSDIKRIDVIDVPSLMRVL